MVSDDPAPGFQTPVEFSNPEKSAFAGIPPDIEFIVVPAKFVIDFSDKPLLSRKNDPGISKIVKDSFEVGMKRPIDTTDRKIMSALLVDGRLTNTQLAEQVGLSAAPCWQRVRRLENEGYISGYTAILDQEKLGFGETVLIDVKLDRHDEDIVASFGRAMAAMPEVLEVYLATGEYDFFIKVAVNGTKGYEDFLQRRLHKIPGIRHSRSSFTLRCLKRAISVSPALIERQGG